MVINININGRLAQYVPSDQIPVCGNSTDTAKFTFDEEWNDVAKKTARFIWGNEHHDEEIKADNTCKVPMFLRTRKVLIGVYAGEAPEDEDCLSTTNAEVEYKISARCTSSVPSAGTGKNYTNEAKGYATEAKGYADEAKAAADEIETLEGKVTDLTYAVDVMEGITGLEGTNFITVKKSTTENSVVLGTWYPEDAWFDGLFADNSIFKIDKIAGGVRCWVDDNASNGFSRCAIKSATFAGKKLFEIPDELIARLDGYGLAYGLEHDNFIMFGESGVYYVQNCYWNSAKFDWGISDPPVCLEPLAKPIITDITDYVNFSGYCEFSNEYGGNPATEAEATMTFEVVEFHDIDNQASFNPYGYPVTLNFEIVGVQ